MQINNNYNNQKLTFGKFKFERGAKSALNELLSKEEQKELNRIINKHRKDIYIDTIISKNGKKFSAKLISNYNDIGIERERNYKQWIFQSPISFIRKLSHKTKKWNKEMVELPDKNINNEIYTII